MNSKRRGVVLFVVLATILLVVILSGVILKIISSQSRLTHHKVSRIKAYYAGRGMMNYALENLRTGAWAANPPGGASKYACHRGCIDTLPGSPDYTIPNDSDIPYRIQIRIYPRDSALSNTVTRLDIKTDYSYTP
jgi:Tfp pilus assembly protein PilX